MSNESDKLAIVNHAYVTIGHTTITSLTPLSTVDADTALVVLESVIKELMADDWYFNRKRILLSDMTQIYKLTVDTAPSPAAFARGATITGASSGVTCTVVDAISDTVYLVTEPTDDFTDGEILSDGTNSVDCATDYPQTEEDLNIDQYQYGFLKPSDCLFIRGIFDIQNDLIKYPHKVEGDIIYSHYNDNCYFQYNKYLTASADVSDVTLTPLWFHRLCSARIAYMLSANRTENQKIRAKAEIDYDTAYLEAKEKNGSEEGAKDWSGHDDWAEGANRELELHSSNDYYYRN
jgi:hypothetical protein